MNAGEKVERLKEMVASFKGQAGNLSCYNSASLLHSFEKVLNDEQVRSD